MWIKWKTIACQLLNWITVKWFDLYLHYYELYILG